MFAEDVPALSANWAAAVTAIAVTVGFIAQIVLQLMARVQAAKIAQQVSADASAAAHRASEVKTALQVANAQKTAQLQQNTDLTAQTLRTVEVVHGLVNDAHGKALLANVRLAEKVAELTGRSEDHQAAAEAREAWAKHDSNQAAVDSKPK